MAYVIGRAEPTSVHVTAYGTGVIGDEQLTGLVLEAFDFRPGKIIEQLKLERPIYLPTACYGHFGKETLPWEGVELVAELKAGAENFR